jgi:hypothetical protein
VKAPEVPFYARAILQETGVAEYPYSTVGAGFFAAFMDLVIFITAKHVLERVDPSSILITPTEGDNALRLHPQFSPTGEESYKDLAFFLYRAKSVETVFPSWQEVSVPLHPDVIAEGRRNFKTGSQFRVCGSPSDKRTIDYDLRRAQLDNVVVPLVYVGVDPVRTYIHSGLIVDDPQLPSYHGLSGSPILSAGDPPGFGGCMIEASHSSRQCHFIDSVVVQHAAADLYRNHRGSAA